MTDDDQSTPDPVLTPADVLAAAAQPATEAAAPDRLLTPMEVAALFGVNPKTVTRWARAGKLKASFTMGGHRRFRASDILPALEELTRQPGDT